jgi:drug/metabolite transporter (DMT)-like permease
LAKLLLGDGVDAWLLAGLLYLGSGFMHLSRGILGVPAPEAPLRRADLPWLGFVVLAGGVVGPLLLMVGLVRTPDSSAALLLDLEGLATMAIVWIVLKENVESQAVARRARHPLRRRSPILPGRP